MTWSLFIDDRRTPEEVYWRKDVQNHKFDVLVTTGVDAIREIANRGCPNFIAFDNDLGLEDSLGLEGRDVAEAIIDMDLYRIITIPEDFKFVVHSMNPIAAEAIHGGLTGYLNFLKDHPR